MPLASTVLPVPLASPTTGASRMFLQTTSTSNHPQTANDREPSNGFIRKGDVIDGKYLVGECIAWGGMGIVTEATHLDLQKAVALKCVRPELRHSEEMVARFLNEARVAANLRNEHVARVLDFGRTEAGIPYLVMERLEGTSLAALVARRGPLPMSEAVDYVLQACEALAEAHARGIVHRDIKPENLFLTQGVDGAPILKVLDFGISKQLLPHIGRSLTNPSSSMGSPCYMSPEQMRNAQLVDTRTDIWAMGVVLFELLVAQPPFDGENVPEICAHVLCDVPRPLSDLRPEIAPGLAAVVHRCLQKQRNDRFADVAQLARALEQYASPDGQASVPIIEHITRIGDPPHSAEVRRLPAESSVRSGPTQADDATDPRITHIPGERARWPWLLAIVVTLAAAAGGRALYRGYDVRRLGYDAVRPLREVLIPERLRDDAPDVRPVERTLEPQVLPDQGPALAEPERDDPSLASQEPAPPPRAHTLRRSSRQPNATAVQPPQEWPAQPLPDDPYSAPALSTSP